MAFPATQLNSSSCGATGLSMTSNVFYDAVIGASDYEVTIINSSLGYSYTRYRGNSNTYMILTLFPGLNYGQTYDVSVKAKVGGAWGPAGETGADGPGV